MEDIRYRNALSEVFSIISNLSENIQNKIPKELILYIEADKNDDYNFFYDKNKGLLEQKMMPETKQILSIIYHDYLCTNEEKEKIENIWKKNEVKNKFNEKEFLTKTNNNLVKDKENNLVEIKKEKIFTKLFKKLKKFFGR